VSQIRFLFDEDTDPDLIDALLRREPAVDALRVDWPEAPPAGTLDPEVLIAAESLGRMLVSNDKKTMPGHLAAHFAAGRHTHGVALLRQDFPWGAYIEDLLILWSVSEAEEWIDGTLYLPL
jgi:hypothetical protein